MTPSIHRLTDHSPITDTDPSSLPHGLLSLTQFTLSSSCSIFKFFSFSQQSTVSFLVSHEPERRLMDLDPNKVKTSSSDLEKLKTGSSALNMLQTSSSLELAKFRESSDMEKLNCETRDSPSELCQLRKEIELSDLKLVESSPKMFQESTVGQIVHQCDPNRNCKSGENCAECVL